jgi:RNA polymerase sigma-70 factor (ECF subfamily)
MAGQQPDTEQLLEEVRRGDRNARSRLLDRHRRRLCNMVGARMDPRLAARFNPSDVVQEALVDADRKLSDYVQQRPLPFYPWLRQFAWNRLVDLHRQHLLAGRRSVTREEMPIPRLPDQSAWELVRALSARGSSPSAHAEREETRQQVQQALARLPERDREVLVLRHLEGMTPTEIAAVLGIREAAVYTRHLRALRRLGELLKGQLGEDNS